MSYRTVEYYDHGRLRNLRTDRDGCGLFSLHNGAMQQHTGTMQFSANNLRSFLRQTRIPRRDVVSVSGWGDDDFDRPHAEIHKILDRQGFPEECACQRLHSYNNNPSDES